jgi:hypothetical protein
MRSMLLAKLLTVKGAAVAAVAVAAGSAAIAATVIPSSPGTPAGKPSAASHAPQEERGVAGSPSPSLHGLCQAVESMPEHARGKALESAAFRALVTAAGGEDEVAAFCAGVERPGGPKEPKPEATRDPHPAPPTASRPGSHPSVPPRP